MLEQWLETEKTGERGASRTYSDRAIEVMATLKALYRWAGGQIEGFVESIFTLMNIPLAVPDHSTLCRRMKILEIDSPVRPTHKARHVVVDSTGVKVYGEGSGKRDSMEWANVAHGANCI